MLRDLTADNIFIVCDHTDMRRSIDGLATLVQQQLQLDPFTDSAFLFCGRRRDRMKVLLLEDEDFLILYKRLEDGKFNWSHNEKEVRNITQEQFVWLLQGLYIKKWLNMSSRSQRARMFSNHCRLRKPAVFPEKTCLTE